MADEKKKTDLTGKLEVSPDILIDVKLDAQHLVDMQVSITEEQLHLEERRLITELDGLNETVSTNNEKIHGILEKGAEVQETAVAKLVTPALKKLGASKIDIDSTWRRYDENKVHVGINVNVHSTRTERVSGRLSFERSFSVSKEAKALEAKTKTLGIQVEEIRKQLTKVKNDIANIPRLERQARARLAMETLKSTPAGKRLADTLERKALAPPK